MTLAAQVEQRFATRVLHPSFGLEIDGLDVSQVLADATVAALRELSGRHKVLVLKGQSLTAAELNDFASRFGDTNQVPARVPKEEEQRHERKHNVAKLGTPGKPGDPGGKPTGYAALPRFWHSDSSWRPIPTWLTMLAAVELPDADGDTCFADMAAAYEALPDERKALLEGKSMIHAWATLSRYEPTAPPLGDSAPPPATHPVVCTVEGRKCLFLGGHTSYYVGNMPFEEGEALFGELVAHATSPEFVYRHQWTPGDLLVWDNRAVMHRVLPWDYSQRRVMHRAEVCGTEVPR